MTATASGFALAIAALFSWGINNALIRVPAMRIGVKQALFYRNLYTALFTLIAFALLVEYRRPPLGQVLFAAALAGLGYVSLLAMFRAKQLGKVGVIAPVANSSVVVTVLIAVFLLGAPMQAGRGAAISVIVAGILLATLNWRQPRASDLFRKESGVPYALVTALCWG